MKNLLIILMLAFSLSVCGQPPKIVGEGYARSDQAHATTDTISNTTPKFQYFEIQGINDVITVQPIFTKISGTAGGTAKLQGSVNGVAYNDISGASYTWTDTATQSTVFNLTSAAFKYYRISYVGSGTQSVKVVTPVLVRRRS